MNEESRATLREMMQVELDIAIGDLDVLLDTTVDERKTYIEYIQAHQKMIRYIDDPNNIEYLTHVDKIRILETVENNNDMSEKPEETAVHIDIDELKEYLSYQPNPNSERLVTECKSFLAIIDDVSSVIDDTDDITAITMFAVLKVSIAEVIEYYRY